MYDITILKPGDPNCVHNEYIDRDTMRGVCRKCGRTKHYEQNMKSLDPVDVEGYWNEKERQEEETIRAEIQQLYSTHSW